MTSHWLKMTLNRLDIEGTYIPPSMPWAESLILTGLKCRLRGWGKSKLTCVTPFGVQKDFKLQVWARSFDYKPFNESPKKSSQSKRVKVEAASEQK